MRPQVDFFNVSDSPSFTTTDTSNNNFGVHQRRVSNNPAPHVMVSALPSHVRDRSGGSGPASVSMAASIFSPATLHTVNATSAAAMQRQTSQGIGISFDNTNSLLGVSGGIAGSTPPSGFSPGVSSSSSSLSLNNNINNNNAGNSYGSAFEGRTLSGGFISSDQLINSTSGSNGNSYMQNSSSSGSGGGGGLLGEEDEPPILEELGIRPDHIRDKVKLVLNPFAATSSHELCMDEDLAGPLTFAICLGFLLTLQGKIHFGAIYGISMIGIAMSYFLLSMMAQQQQQQQQEGGQAASSAVRLTLVISTLGYCLLPDLLLAAFSTAHVWMFGRAAGTGFLLTGLCLVTVVWSAWCAMKIFAEAFNLHHARYLILYPAFLFYAVFAAITLF